MLDYNVERVRVSSVSALDTGASSNKVPDFCRQGELLWLRSLSQLGSKATGSSRSTSSKDPRGPSRLGNIVAISSGSRSHTTFVFAALISSSVQCDVELRRLFVVAVDFIVRVFIRCKTLSPSELLRDFMLRRPGLKRAKLRGYTHQATPHDRPGQRSEPDSMSKISLEPRKEGVSLSAESKRFTRLALGPISKFCSPVKDC